ncbi:hypothetical protein KMP13_14425 [Epibacterium ulvae]|uniref:hypothetical protein n=1 Tax=Epibacterium ulvae TaxID=1156985 RepID=UPI001BFCAF5D|nr:hypothetical protein [Epibacterium ulvae]MBT8155044.1 hypothetical protein [Epibacterium ulvae]
MGAIDQFDRRVTAGNKIYIEPIMRVIANPARRTHSGDKGLGAIAKDAGADSGLGIALISAHTVPNEVYNDRLVVLNAVPTPIVRKRYLLSARDFEPPPPRAWLKAGSRPMVSFVCRNLCPPEFHLLRSIRRSSV